MIELIPSPVVIITIIIIIIIMIIITMIITRRLRLRAILNTPRSLKSYRSLIRNVIITLAH